MWVSTPPSPPHCTPVMRIMPAGAHYYCESIDVTRPFPSDRPVSDPSWPFVWNKALSSPFRRLGLDGPNAVCPALLQVGMDDVS
jgi:hypothetical protein